MAVEPPFASVSDLADRWPEFPDEKTALAETLLVDASQYILDEAPRAAEAVSELTLRRITCSLVRRYMDVTEEDGYGVETTQESAGPFSESRRSVSPYGDFILSPRERAHLGAGAQVAFSIDLMPDPDEPRR